MDFPSRLQVANWNSLKSQMNWRKVRRNSSSRSYIWPGCVFITLIFGTSDLEKLVREFEAVLDVISKRRNRHLAVRFINSSKDKDDLVQFKAKIDEAVNVLNVSLHTHTVR